ncbi:hypothetical protein [uncultured Vagococcus sp.]|uniref:hypothetical protein n=1 Tax=uncultured Vagococcus sp. TaxID=189676 RepID=UPI00258432D0|nr:hypothetical protein [uncultured Vagococcus sp.]
MNNVAYKQASKQSEYDKRCKELEQINKVLHITSKNSMTIFISDILELRTNDNKKVFHFRLLAKHLSQKMTQQLETSDDFYLLKIGIQIDAKTIRYYSIKKIRKNSTGHIYDLLIHCFSLEERNYLIQLYNSQ